MWWKRDDRYESHDAADEILGLASVFLFFFLPACSFWARILHFSAICLSVDYWKGFLFLLPHPPTQRAELRLLCILPGLCADAQQGFARVHPATLAWPLQNCRTSSGSKRWKTSGLHKCRLRSITLAEGARGGRSLQKCCSSMAMVTERYQPLTDCGAWRQRLPRLGPWQNISGPSGVVKLGPPAVTPRHLDSSSVAPGFTDSSLLWIKRSPPLFSKCLKPIQVLFGPDLKLLNLAQILPFSPGSAGWIRAARTILRSGRARLTRLSGIPLSIRNTGLSEGLPTVRAARSLSNIWTQMVHTLSLFRTHTHKRNPAQHLQICSARVHLQFLNIESAHTVWMKVRGQTSDWLESRWWADISNS